MATWVWYSWSKSAALGTRSASSIRSIHRTVGVSVRWNTSPGSRGPVESHTGEFSVGFEPFVV